MNSICKLLLSMSRVQSDLLDLRRELLLSIQKISSSKYRKPFLRKLDHLLDEKYLLGQSTHASLQLRHLAYNTLAELIIHSKEDLTFSMISSIICTFIRNLHDRYLRLSTQKLSLNIIMMMAEMVYRNEQDGSKSSFIFVRIMNSLAEKCDSVFQDASMEFGYFRKKNITWNSSNALLYGSIFEARLLVFELTRALKQIVLYMINHSSRKGLRVGLSKEESQIFSSFIKNVVSVFDIFDEDAFPISESEQSYNSKVPKIPFEKFLELLVEALALLDFKGFRSVMAENLELIFSKAIQLKRLDLVSIFSMILSRDSISPVFTDLILNFIIDKLCMLKEDISPVNSKILQLFKLAVASLKCIKANEDVFRPYIKHLVAKSIELAIEAEFPETLFMFIRTLYRGISGGRFEVLYKEILPLLQEVLPLLSTYSKHGLASFRHLATELIMLTPAQLSSLLPFTSTIMDAVSDAICSSNSNESLLRLGIKTLDFWIDNCDLEFLYPYLQPCSDKLMRCLCSQLHPNKTESLGSSALTVIGKLGGMNRLFLRERLNLPYKDLAEESLNLLVQFKGGNIVQVPFGRLTKEIIQLFLDGSQSESLRKSCYKAIKAILSAMCNVQKTDRTSDFSNDDGKFVLELNFSEQKQNSHLDLEDSIMNSKPSKVAQEELFKEVLACIICASAIDFCRCEDSEKILDSLCTHFAMLYSLDIQKSPSHQLRHFDELVFVKSILIVMKNESKSLFEAGVQCLRNLLKSIELLVGHDSMDNLPAIGFLLDELCHHCHLRTALEKSIGSIGLRTLVFSMSFRWIRKYHIDLIRALLSSLTDDTHDTVSAHCDLVYQTLEVVIRCSLGAPQIDGSYPFASSDGYIIDAAHQRSERLQTILSVLAPALLNPFCTVRDFARRLIELLSRLSNQEELTLLQRYREKMQIPIFKQVLYGASTASRIGYVSTITTWLQFGDVFADARQPMQDLISTVIKEVIEASNTTSMISMNSIGKKKLSFKLRLEQLKFLAMVLRSPDTVIRSDENRDKIVKVFFKSLTQASDEVVEVAKKALEHQDLPKELIRECLRPILVNLSDHRRLSVRLLKLLARLLELLRRCFNQALGDRLVLHLTTLTNGLRQVYLTHGKSTSARTHSQSSEKPSSVSPKADQETVFLSTMRRYSSEIHIAMAIIDLFHLLPGINQSILPQFVQNVVELEEIFCVVGSFGDCQTFHSGYLSPLRKPLYLFLNSQVEQSLSFFLEYRNLLDRHKSQLFISFLGSVEGRDVAARLMQNYDRFLNVTFSPQNRAEISTEDLAELELQGVKICNVLSQVNESWFSSCDSLVMNLKTIFDARLANFRPSFEEDMHTEQVFLPVLIAKCFVRYLRKNSLKIDIMWSCLHCLTYRTLADFSFLHTFFVQFIPRLPVDVLKDLLLLLIKKLKHFHLAAPSLGFSQLEPSVRAFELVILPIIEHFFRIDVAEHILQEEIISQLLFFLSVENLSEEFLGCAFKLINILVSRLPSKMAEFKNEVFSFAWKRLNLDHLTSRLHAMVCLSHLFVEFEFPETPISSLYLNLLSSYKSDNRVILDRAFSILMPVVPKKLNSMRQLPNGASVDYFPSWICYTRQAQYSRVEFDIINFWTIVCRFKSIFFPFRKLFSSDMLKCVENLEIKGPRDLELLREMSTLLECIMYWEGQSEDYLSVSKRTKLENVTLKKVCSSDNIPGRISHVLTYLLCQLGQQPIGDFSIISSQCVSLFQTFCETFSPSNVQIDLKKCISSFSLNLNSEDTLKRFDAAFAILSVVYKCQDYEYARRYADDVVFVISQALAHVDTVGESLLKFFADLFGALDRVNDQDLSSDLPLQTILTFIQVHLHSDYKGPNNIVEYCLKIMGDCNNRIVSKFFMTTLKNDILSLLTTRTTFTENHESNNGRLNDYHDVDYLLDPIIICLSLNLIFSINLNESEIILLEKIVCTLVEHSNDSQIILSILQYLSRTLAFRNRWGWILKHLMRFCKKNDDLIRSEFLAYFVKIMRAYMNADAEGSVHCNGLADSITGSVCNYLDSRNLFSEFSPVLINGIRSMDKNLLIELWSIFSIQEFSIEDRFFVLLGEKPWKSLEDNCLIELAVELLLDSVDGSLKVSTSPKSFCLPGVILVSPSDQLGSSINLGADKYYDVVNALSQVSFSEILPCFQDIFRHSRSCVHMFWSLMFSSVWGSLTITTEKHDKIFNSLSDMIVSGYLNSQRMERPNAVKTFLEGIVQFCNTVSSHKFPKFSLEVVSYCSSNFNAWIEGIFLLQSYLSVTSDVSEERVINRQLIKLYSILNENDIKMASEESEVDHMSLRTVISYEQFRVWDKAVEEIASMFHSKVDLESLPFEEYCVLNREYIRCARNMCAWDSLYEHSFNTKDSFHLLESSAMLQDYEQIPGLLNGMLSEKFSIPDETLSAVKLKLYELYSLVDLDPEASLDSKFQDLLTSIVEKWHCLPSYISSSHERILELSQNVIEVSETRSVLCSLGMNSPGSQVPDLSKLISTWRERIPNVWESLPVWHELFSWRIHSFEKFRHKCMLSDFSTLYEQLDDTTWTTVKLATVSRKHRLPSLSLQLLGSLSSVKTMDSMDAFLTIREFIKSSLQNTAELNIALQSIRNINLDYFNNQQKAELLRFKGKCLYRLGLPDESNAAYSASSSINELDCKTWAAWGSLCDRMFSISKEHQWAEWAIAAYLQAVAYGSERARMMLTRLLWLLSFDSKDGQIIKVFDRYASSLPLWVWILWVPQLLTSLSRVEGNYMFKLLVEIARAYPQAVYCTIRAFLIEKRELFQARTHQMQAAIASNRASDAGQATGRTYIMTATGMHKAPSSSMDSRQVSATSDGTSNFPRGLSQGEAKEVNGEDQQFSNEASEIMSRSGLELAEDLIRVFRHNYFSLATEIERMLEEITKKLKPDPEEELLGAVNTVFIRCFRSPVASPDAVPRQILETVDRILSKFFAHPSNFSMESQIFLSKYKADFERDFSPTSPQFPANLTELMRRLRKWKTKLQCRIDAKGRGSLMLEKLSNNLCFFQSNELEIPGQYLVDHEPSSSQHVLLESFEPDVHILRSHGFSPRRIGMRGSDGKVYYFLIQYSLPHLMRSEERMMQMTSVLNRCLRKYSESQRRNLRFCFRVTSPLTHRLRLVESHPADISLENVYVQSFSGTGNDPDLPLRTYRNRIGSAPSWERNAAARLETFRLISQKCLLPTTLSRFIQKSLTSFEHLWEFKKQFAMQLSLSSFLGYIVKVGDRVPYKISFSRSSGELINSEFYPVYNNNQVIELSESVPFRLTPNLTTFLSPHLVNGIFGTSMISAAACMIKHQDILKNFMYLFFRDDIMSYSSSQLTISSDQDQQVIESRFREKISVNTLEVLSRLHVIMSTVDPGDSRGKSASRRRQVHRLIADATNESNLSMMTPVWHPWF